MTTENVENPEISSYPTKIAGLTGIGGEELGEIEVPLFSSVKALEFQSRVVGQQYKFLEKTSIVATDGDGKPVEGSKTLDINMMLDLAYAPDGIKLQIDLLCEVMLMSRVELGQKFSKESLNLLYAFILRRDFGTLADTIEEFSTRFSNILGTEKKVPVDQQGGES